MRRRGASAAVLALTCKDARKVIFHAVIRTKHAFENSFQAGLSIDLPLRSHISESVAAVQ
jgi:hypothetical protein